MTECTFLIKEAEEGGFTARALDYDIFTDGDTVEELRENIKDAVLCHFDNVPSSIICLPFLQPA